MKTHASPSRRTLDVIEPLEARISPALITATWLGGDGNWNDPSKWSTGVVPNNAGDTHYHVVLNDAAITAFIAVHSAITVDGIENHEVLTVSDGASLAIGSSVNDGTLSIGAAANPTLLTLAGTLTNTGSLNLNLAWPYAGVPRVALASDATIIGVGAINLNTAAARLTGEPGAELTIGAGQQLHGIGTVEVPLIHYGTLQADVDGGVLSVSAPIENHGVIDALGNGILNLAGSDITNAGQMIRAAGGIVRLDNTTISGGTLQATDSASSRIELRNTVSFDGVTLDDPGAGYFVVPGGATARLDGDRALPTGATLNVEDAATLDLSGGAFSNAATINVQSAWTTTTLTLGGTLTNTGAINLSLAWPYSGVPRIDLADDASVTGAGAMTLNALASRISGVPDAALTIGSGQVMRGVGRVEVPVVNSGSIQASLAGTLAMPVAIENHGTLEAIDSGFLDLGGAAVTNAGGLIRATSGTVQVRDATIGGGSLQVADYAPSRVELRGDVTLNGVALLDSGAGLFTVPGTTTRLLGDRMIPAAVDLLVDDGGTLDLSGSGFTNAGTINVRAAWNPTTLTLGGALTNTGTINTVQEWPYSGAPRFYVASDSTLAGAGTANLNVAVNRIAGAPGADLTIGAGQTLRGLGTVEVPLINLGTISAPSGTLSLPVVIENHSVIRANGGVIALAGGSVTGGTLEVNNDAASQVTFANDVTLSGVTLVDGGAGIFLVPGGPATRLHGDLAVPAGVELVVADSANLHLTDGTFSNAGRIRIQASWSATTLTLDDAFTNTGEIRGSLDWPSAGSARLHLAADTTIAGAGNIVFADAQTQLTGEPGAELTLGAGQTLSGRGFIHTLLINYGTVATDPGTLTIDNAVENHGVLVAGSGGVLSFVGSTVTNTGQVIRAGSSGTIRLENSTIVGGNVELTDSPGSRVELRGDVTFTGTTLLDGGAGYFAVPGAVTTRLLGDRLLPAGVNFVVEDSATLDLRGAPFVNAGTITLQASWSPTRVLLGGSLTNSGTINADLSWPYAGPPQLEVATPTTIDGSGQINLNASNSRITGDPLATLEIAAQQSVQGKGAIDVAMTNRGLISADAGELTATAAIQNFGTLDARAGGTLRLAGDVTLLVEGALATDPVSEIVLAANLLGSDDGALPATTPHARVRIEGAPLVPRLFEVSGADLGYTLAGFAQNRVLDRLVLSGSFLRLTDNTDDAPGADALYIDTLVVPAGATLDLNGCRVHVRNSNIQGTIIGDLGPPESHALPLPSAWLGADLRVAWTGSDDAGGSGVAAFDVFVSRDGEPFQLWLDDTAETSAIYPAEAGHRYAFYTVARDNLAFIEAAPLVPDAMTDVRILAITTAALDGATEDANYGFTMQSNADGIADVPLTWSLVTAPAGLTVGATTGTFSGVLDNTAVGDNTVTVRLDDDQGHHAEQTFTLSVTNVAGEFTAQTPGAALLGVGYAFDLDSTDEGAGAVTYNIVNGPAWLTIDPTTGVLGGIPSIHDLAAPGVTVGVDDGHGGTDATSFTLDVFGQHLVLDPALRQTKAVFTDANGDAVTATLTGKTGRVHLYRSIAPDGTGQYLNTTAGDLFAVELEGTDIKSALTLTPKANKRLQLGDGFSTLGSVTGDGSLARLSAAKFDLIGPEIDLPLGTIATLTLHDVKNGADVTLGGAQALKGVSFTAHDLDDGSALAFGSTLKLLKANEWTGGTLTAPSAGSLRVAGDLNADLTFAGPVKLLRAGNFSGGSIHATSLGSLTVGDDASFDLTLTDELAKTTLGRTRIGGDLLGSVWDVAGKIASITVARTIGDTIIRSGTDITTLSMGASDGSVFGAGVDLATLIANGHADTAPTGTIKTFKVNGWKIPKLDPIPRFMSDTQVSAKMGTMSLHNWDGLGGLWAPAGAIKKITHHDTVLKDAEHNWVFPEPPRQVSGQPELFVHVL